MTKMRILKCQKIVHFIISIRILFPPYQMAAWCRTSANDVWLWQCKDIPTLSWPKYTGVTHGLIPDAGEIKFAQINEVGQIFESRIAKKLTKMLGEPYIWRYSWLKIANLKVSFSASDRELKGPFKHYAWRGSQLLPVRVGTRVLSHTIESREKFVASHRRYNTRFWKQNAK